MSGILQKLNGATLPPVDVITGGSPLSGFIGGRPEGWLGGRTPGLFMDQVRITKEMRKPMKSEMYQLTLFDLADKILFIPEGMFGDPAPSF